MQFTIGLEILNKQEIKDGIMAHLIGSEASHDKINYLSLKCTKSASNVRTFEADSIHLRPIFSLSQSDSCTFEADFENLKISNF